MAAVTDAVLFQGIGPTAIEVASVIFGVLEIFVFALFVFPRFFLGALANVVIMVICLIPIIVEYDSVD